MDSWKRTFLNRLHEAQAKCAGQFEEALDRVVGPVFDGLADFLRDNEFKISRPLNEPRRRSFKLELAENAYLLIILRFSGVDAFELSTETFTPGREPILERSLGRVSDLDRDWAQRLFQGGLDRFVELLADEQAAKPSAAVAAV